MESEIKKSVTVNVLGNEYLLKGTSSPAQILAASEYVDNLLKKLLKTNSHVNHQKLLVLTCINLADELIKIKQEVASKSEARQVPQVNKGQKAPAQQNGTQQRIFQQNVTNQNINKQRAQQNNSMPDNNQKKDSYLKENSGQKTVSQNPQNNISPQQPKPDDVQKPKQ